MSQNPFNEQIIDAVRSHMNMDHPEDSLLIVKGLGGRDDATSALMSTMDGEAVEFTAQFAGGPEAVRVPWSQPISERAQVRVEITQMYHDACAKLGVAPREAEEH